jgi:hypothetical protein
MSPDATLANLAEPCKFVHRACGRASEAKRRRNRAESCKTMHRPRDRAGSSIDFKNRAESCGDLAIVHSCISCVAPNTVRRRAIPIVHRGELRMFHETFLPPGVSKCFTANPVWRCGRCMQHPCLQTLQNVAPSPAVRPREKMFHERFHFVSRDPRGDGSDHRHPSADVHRPGFDLEGDGDPEG